ncbi:hypothetical protein NX059_011961 [Plenodomus lindquistii]|nr:hypothetical protein NX059_011961 [Plenodomus lindquistii]
MARATRDIVPLPLPKCCHSISRVESVSYAVDSNTIAATLLTDIDKAEAALKNVSVVTSITQLASETASGRIRIYALKTPRMLTLVIFLQLGEHLVESGASMMRKYVFWHVSCHDFFSSLFDSVYISRIAPAILPFNATNVAKLCLTFASVVVS